ncbi:hypothetical protein [Demequina aurantiaca]|uniref:hypothetical protein n=1 Tax=Demequina aurantiaca TaxID=676200 RepID=UPI003D341E23
MRAWLIVASVVALAGCSASADTVTVTETPAPIVITATPDPISMLSQDCQDALGVAGDVVQSSGALADMQDEVVTAVQDTITAARDLDIASLLESTAQLNTLANEIDVDGLTAQIDDFVAASQTCTGGAGDG